MTTQGFKASWSMRDLSPGPEKLSLLVLKHFYADACKELVNSIMLVEEQNGRVSSTYIC